MLAVVALHRGLQARLHQPFKQVATSPAVPPPEGSDPASTTGLARPVAGHQALATELDFHRTSTLLVRRARIANRRIPWR